MSAVVALVPAYNRADTVAATVRALRGVRLVNRVLVVDDGSTDATAEVARAAGAEVLRLPANRGKGGAVLAGVAASPDADIYLLMDADLAGTAGQAARLLDPVVAGDADMVIGVLPAAGARGGFGFVRRLAAWGIRRAAGMDARAPLSGQRAVRAPLLRSLADAERFGLEVALTIDAVRAGARVAEVDVAMDHRHAGRSLRGFAHRGRQGADILRAVAPRLTSARTRALALVVAGLFAVGVMAWSGQRWVPASAPLGERAEKVVVFGMGPLGIGDLGTGRAPALDGLLDDGAVAAMSVRTVPRHPTLSAGYVSLGAGSRLSSSKDADVAFDAGTPLPGGTAAEILSARTGAPVDGDIAVLGGTATVKLNRGSGVPSGPGALGDALAAAGLVSAAVGNGDQPGVAELPSLISRPAALAAMDSSLSVPVGTVDESLLMPDTAAPFGVRADAAAVLDAVDDALSRADVLFVDPGDLERADAFARQALPAAASSQRLEALRRTDELLASMRDHLPDGTLLLVVSVSAPGATFRLTPFVAVGPGVPTGWVVSPSTKRLGIVALTDLAPTILDALGADVPDELTGNPLRYRAGTADLGRLRDFDRDTNLRERTYYPQAVGFIVYQALLYLLAMFVVTRRTRVPRLAPVLRVLVLAASAFPLGTYLMRLVPDVGDLGVGQVAVPVVFAVVCALAVSRARRHPLSPLCWIMAATIVVVIADASTGTWLHVSSWLGYSLHSAGRFYGIPNTTFALLASGAVLLACAHVQFAGRRREAVVGACVLLAVVLVADGAPSLGGDVGGIIALVPVFGAVAIALAGRRLRVRTALLIGSATVALVCAAAAIDLMRPEDARTHLGRFANDFVNDPSELLDTFVRKQSANLRILQVSVWTWMIPVVVIFLLYVLVWERQWQELLPRRAPVRVGTVAVLAGALLGFLANDSGPIVIALFFVFLLPFLTLLALHRARGEPVLLEPPPARDDADLVIAA